MTRHLHPVPELVGPTSRAAALRERLSSGSGAVLATRVAAHFAGVVVLLGALLLHGAELTGIFVMTVTISQIAAMPVGAGFGRTLTREVSRGDHQAAASTWASGLVVAVPLAALSVAVGAVLLAGRLPLLVVSVSLVASTVGLAVLQLEAADRRGRGRPVATSTIEGLVPQAVSLLAIGFGFLGAEAFVVSRGLLLMVAAMVVARPPSWDPRRPKNVASWLSSANAAVVAGTQLLLVRSDLLLVGWLIGPDKVAFYAIMQRIAETVYWPVSAYLVGAAPRYAAAEDGSDLHDAVMAERRSLRASQLLATGAAGGASAAAIAVSVVRPEMGLALAFLVASSLVMVRYGPETALLIMRDEVGRVALVGLLGLTLNIAIGSVLLGIVGVPGAAFATLVSVSTMYVSLRRVAFARVGVTASL